MKWLARLLDSFATKHFSDYDPDQLPSWELISMADYGAFFGVPMLTSQSDLSPLLVPTSLAVSVPYHSAPYKKDVTNHE